MQITQKNSFLFAHCYLVTYLTKVSEFFSAIVSRSKTLLTDRKTVRRKRQTLHSLIFIYLSVDLERRYQGLYEFLLM